MRTPKEIDEAKYRIIEDGKLIEELTQHKGYQLLEKRLQTIVNEAKEAIIASKDFEDLLQKRAYYQGLLALSQEVENFLGKFKSQINK